MRHEDIGQATEIDREAFPTLWPPVNLHRELLNSLAHYLVAYDDTREFHVVAPAPPVGLRAAMARAGRWLSGRGPSAVSPASGNGRYLVGFAGIWIMAGEAHLTDIAVREQYRRQGIGELLIISAIEIARRLEARMLTLEVRASNTGAQALYYKYGFDRVGLRRGYYIDNKEDAILMSTGDIDSPPFLGQLEELKEAHARKAGHQFAPSIAD